MRREVRLSEYISLTEAFLAKRISAAQYEKHFFDILSEDGTIRGEPAYSALNKLFEGVEQVCLEPTPVIENGISEDFLRQIATLQLRTLKEVAEKNPQI